ncbi:HNH endonuclease [Bacillus sp. ISL-53]|nr:HNH endonuclease [Bacillus sp. ISL-53]
MDEIIQDARTIDYMQKFIHKKNEFFTKTYKQILKPIVDSYTVSVIDNETIIIIENKDLWWITIGFYKNDNSYRIRFECYQNDFIKEDIVDMFNGFQGLDIEVNINNEVIVFKLSKDFFEFHNFEEPEFLELIQLTYLSNLKKSGSLSFNDFKEIRCIKEESVFLYKRLSNSILHYFWSESAGESIEKLFCKSMFQDRYITINNIHAREFFNFVFSKYKAGRKRRTEVEIQFWYEQKNYQGILLWNKGSHPKLLLNEQFVAVLTNRYSKIEQVLSQGLIGEYKVPSMKFSKQNDNELLIDIKETVFKIPIYNVNESSERTIEEFKEFQELDIMGVSLQRREQHFLRRYLFHGKVTEQCAICGNELPITFLVAAHIKPRAKCTDSEKIDFRNIVVPMCKFGCDELFERGYISVQKCKVVSIPRYIRTTFLDDYINSIVEKEIKFWSKDKEKYFQWHYNYHVDNGKYN